MRRARITIHFFTAYFFTTTLQSYALIKCYYDKSILHKTIKHFQSNNFGNHKAFITAVFTLDVLLSLNYIYYFLHKKQRSAFNHPVMWFIYHNPFKSDTFSEKCLCIRFSVVSNIEPLNVRSFPLRKVCICARSKFENVIFCWNLSQILRNTRQTFNVYLMKMFEYVRICSNI